MFKQEKEKEQPTANMRSFVYLEVHFFKTLFCGACFTQLRPLENWYWQKCVMDIERQLYNAAGSFLLLPWRREYLGTSMEMKWKWANWKKNQAKHDDESAANEVFIDVNTELPKSGNDYLFPLLLNVINSHWQDLSRRAHMCTAWDSKLKLNPAEFNQKSRIELCHRIGKGRTRDG